MENQNCPLRQAVAFGWETRARGNKRLPAQKTTPGPQTNADHVDFQVQTDSRYKSAKT
jgi:hypothetical protein